MSELDTAKAAANAAQLARVRLEHERDEARAALIAQVDVQISAQFGDRIAAARAAEAAACRALNEAEERAGRAAHAGMFAGVLVRWERRESSRYARDWALRPAEKRGRYEIRGAQSEFAANKTYDIPKYGERFVRFLKKDGSPGLGFDRTEYSSSVWLPEGEEPVGSEAR